MTSDLYKASIAQRVSKIIAEQLGIEESFIAPEKNLVVDLGADSFDTDEISLALEVEFDIEPDFVQVAALLTVRKIIDHVASLSSIS